jgi:hypothetical protein
LGVTPHSNGISDDMITGPVIAVGAGSTALFFAADRDLPAVRPAQPAPGNLHGLPRNRPSGSGVVATRVTVG